MGTLWPKSASFEFDQNGVAAPGALAYFFEAETSTPRPVYQDAALSTTHTHPVVADGDGRWPAVFLSFGSYKQVLKTSAGTTLSTIDDIPNPAPFTDAFTLDTTTILNTGDIWAALKNGTRSGAVRLNGRTIGSAASSATERANADCSDLYAYLWNNTANGQCPVATGRGATAVADFAADKAITLPDWRAVGPTGFDDMGNTAASLLGSAPVITGSGILAGSILGENTHVLTVGELATHTPAGTISQITPAGTISQITPAGTITVAQPTHLHASLQPGSFGGTVSGVSAVAASGNIWCNSGATTANTTSVATGDTATFAGTPTTPTFTGTPTTPTFTGASVGSNTAHNNLARAAPVTWFIKL